VSDYEQGYVRIGNVLWVWEEVVERWVAYYGSSTTPLN
jgi:hypothetical protein